MKKPKVSVTTLEQFRRFMSGKYDYMTEESLIESVIGTFEGNTKTRIGTALHSIVENGDEGLQKVPEGTREFLYYGKPKQEPVPKGYVVFVDNFPVFFDEKQVETIVDYRNEHIDCFHEIKIRKDYGEIVLSGMADLIEGVGIRDMKTKFSTPDDDEYIDSLQWKFYCDMFEAEEFRFDLFEVMDYNENRHGYDIRGLELKLREPIVLYPYPAMLQDIDNNIKEFISWCKLRNLYDKLERIEI